MANSHDLFNFNITQNDWIYASEMESAREKAETIESARKPDNNLHWRLPICVHNCNRWTYFTGQLLTLDTPNTIQYAMPNTMKERFVQQSLYYTWRMFTFASSFITRASHIHVIHWQADARLPNKLLWLLCVPKWKSKQAKRAAKANENRHD